MCKARTELKSVYHLLLYELVETNSATYRLWAPMASVNEIGPPGNNVPSRKYETLIEGSQNP
jgi:hypothetical protein